MNRRIVYSALARQDLRGVRRWSVTAFGQAQTEYYIRELGAALNTLALNPGIGRDAGEIRPGLRKILAGSHVVFFNFDDAEIRVIRILHGRMEPQKWM